MRFGPLCLMSGAVLRARPRTCAPLTSEGCVTIIKTHLLLPRIMYAARDITGTVGCLGLIVSSIISKKVIITITMITLITKITVRWRRGSVSW